MAEWKLHSLILVISYMTAFSILLVDASLYGQNNGEPMCVVQLFDWDIKFNQQHYNYVHVSLMKSFYMYTPVLDYSMATYVYSTYY